MSKNKYLEKIASERSDFYNDLARHEKRIYNREYETAKYHHPFKVGGAVMLIGAGSTLGFAGGASIAKPLSQKIANKLKDRGIISGKYKMKNGDHNLQHILHDGAKVHSKARAILPLAGMLIGALPGAILLDKVRHNHAKSVIEKRRNYHD